MLPTSPDPSSAASSFIPVAGPRVRDLDDFLLTPLV
jgi:hypothetical protein